jgi:hypothetical protein
LLLLFNDDDGDDDDDYDYDDGDGYDDTKVVNKKC